MTADVATARAAKQEGQHRSQGRLTAEQEAAFFAVIEDLRPGTEFSVNRIRDRLDSAGVPNVSRAGLFRRAIARELITPVAERTISGATVLKREPSTGASAHAAHVQVYRRTGEPPSPDRTPRSPGARSAAVPVSGGLLDAD